jgi:hypothetical protein
MKPKNNDTAVSLKNLVRRKISLDFRGIFSYFNVSEIYFLLQSHPENNHEVKGRNL